MKSLEAPLVALSIAGSDPGAGAGIQADLKVFAAHGIYGATVLTALTVQNTLGVSDTLGVPVAFIRAQYRALKEDLHPRAAKTGMLFSEEIVLAVAQMLGRPPLPLVVDPVLVSSSGHALMSDEGLKAYREQLIPLATIFTPNLDEAARLLGSVSIQTLAAMREACVKLLALGCRSVYLKGGHLPGETCVDVFYDGEFLELTAPRVETQNTHGTGCALSAALTANLAKGLDLKDAARAAKVYVQGALEGAKDWKMGQGKGPLAHFHNEIK